MKKMIYILSVLIAILAGICSEKHHDSESRNNADFVNSELRMPDNSTSTISAKDTEFNLPRQTNFSPVPRAQSSARRNLSNGFSTVKILLSSGKLIDCNSTDNYRKTIILFPSGIHGLSHHLIILRKLII